LPDNYRIHAPISAIPGVVQKVPFLGNTDNVNFGWFAYDSTDGHPKKCYPLILNHARFAANRMRRRTGGDALQKQSQGHVVPDSFTHGTSAQRVRWLRRSLESGQVNDCDTFAARQL